MSIEWMKKKGFPAAHIEAMRHAPPGTEVNTDYRGTSIEIPSSSREAFSSSSFIPNRVFNPLFSNEWKGPVNPAALVQYDAEREVSYTCYSTIFTPNELEWMESSLAVFVDGACRDNGKPGAKAAYGCYFGPSSRYNLSGTVSSECPQTSQVAEITAAINALERAEDIRGDIGLMEVVVITDSDYVFQAMTNWIYKWRNNGWKTKGGMVKNKELLEKLDKMIVELEMDLLEVKFWKVGRDMNAEADKLAKEALNQ